MSIQAINVRNQFKGKVREVIRGDVVSEVDVETPWVGRNAQQPGPLVSALAHEVGSAAR